MFEPDCLGFKKSPFFERSEQRVDLNLIDRLLNAIWRPHPGCAEVGEGQRDATSLGFIMLPGIQDCDRLRSKCLSFDAVALL